MTFESEVEFEFGNLKLVVNSLTAHFSFLVFDEDFEKTKYVAKNATSDDNIFNC